MHRVRLPVLLARHPRQHRQRASQPAFDAEPDIRIEPIPHHTRPLPLKLELPLNGIHHRLARFAQRQRLLPAHHLHQRGAHRARAGEQRPRGGQRAVCVRGEEKRAPPQVVVCVCEFQVVEVVVEADEDDADGGVERGAGCEGVVVGGLDLAPQGRVRAADVGDGFRVELGLDAGFAEDEDGAAV